MVRVFLDSNVWFSAFYYSENCEKIINAGKKGKIALIISQQVVKETIRNIKEKKPDQLENFRNFILENPPEIFSDRVGVPPATETLIASEDAPVFLAAISAKVKFFVTSNIRDFAVKRLGKFTGIKILTPKEAVKALGL